MFMTHIGYSIETGQVINKDEKKRKKKLFGRFQAIQANIKYNLHFHIYTQIEVSNKTTTQIRFVKITIYIIITKIYDKDEGRVRNVT